MFRRHGAEKRHLEQEIDHGAQQNRTENGQRHATSGVMRLPGKIHRALKPIEAEYDSTGSHCREYRGEITNVGPAVCTHVEVARMKARGHECDGGGGRHYELEGSDCA